MIREITCVLFLSTLSAPALAQQEIKAFAAIDERSEAQLDFAIRYVERLMTVAPTARFEILLTGKAIDLVRADNDDLAKRVDALATKYPTVSVSICKEGTKGSRERSDDVGLVVAAKEVDCASRWKELKSDGWRRIRVVDADVRGS